MGTGVVTWPEVSPAKLVWRGRLGGREEVSDQSFGGTQPSDTLPWKQAGEERERVREREKKKKTVAKNDWRRHMCPALYLYHFSPTKTGLWYCNFSFFFSSWVFPLLWKTLLMFLNLNIIKARRMDIVPLTGPRVSDGVFLERSWARRGYISPENSWSNYLTSNSRVRRLIRGDVTTLPGGPGGTNIYCWYGWSREQPWQPLNITDSLLDGWRWWCSRPGDL